MQDDLKLFTTNTLSLALGLLRAVVSLSSFVFILWTLSGPLAFSLGSWQLAVPGYMVWAALSYAIGGTWVAHKIGRPLIRLHFEQQEYEADLRYALTRLRENAEGVALYGGERDERGTLLTRFASVWQNWWSLIRYQKRLIGFTAFYEQLASVFPFVVAAPRYFARQPATGRPYADGVGVRACAGCLELVHRRVCATSGVEGNGRSSHRVPSCHRDCRERSKNPGSHHCTSQRQRGTHGARPAAGVARWPHTPGWYQYQLQARRACAGERTFTARNARCVERSAPR